MGAAFAAGLRNTTEELALALGLDSGRAVLLFAVADGRPVALGLGWGFGLAGPAAAAAAAGRRSTGADLGPALDRLWADFRLTLGRLWSDSGATLGRGWADFEPTLGCTA